MTELWEDSAEYKELNAFYETTWADGVWVREIGGGACFMVGAGFVADLEYLERRSGKEIDIKSLALGDLVMGGFSIPGIGDTRIEACRDAVANLRKHAGDKTHLLKWDDA